MPRHVDGFLLVDAWCEAPRNLADSADGSSVVTALDSSAGDRPKSIAVVAWLFIAVGAVGSVTGFVRFFQSVPAEGWSALDTHDVLDFVYASTSLLAALVAGAFLLRRHAWTRWLLVAWMAFHIVLSAMHSTSQLLVHVVLFAPVTWILFLRRTSAWLAGREDR